MKLINRYKKDVPLAVAIIEKDMVFYELTHKRILKRGTLLYLCKDDGYYCWYVNKNNTLVTMICSGNDLRHVRLLRPEPVKQEYNKYAMKCSCNLKDWDSVNAHRTYK